MAISNEHIRGVLESYLGAYPGEKDGLSGGLALLDAGADIASRKEWAGHATAGAVLLDGQGRVLHIRHLALAKWLLPGGHLEPEDLTLRGAALRELTEETGVDPDAVVPVDAGPVHIDLHPIPANPGKGEPAHQHLDVRYLFRLSGRPAALRIQEEEVDAYAWRPVADVVDPVLRGRLVELLG